MRYSRHYRKGATGIGNPYGLKKRLTNNRYSKRLFWQGTRVRRKRKKQLYR